MKAFCRKALYAVSFIFTLVFMGCDMLWGMFTRKASRLALSYPNIKRAMIIGAGEVASKLIREMKSDEDFSYIPVIVIDDENDKYGSKLHGVPVKGGISKIIELAECLKVDEIIVAAPHASRQAIADILNICKRTNCKLKLVPNGKELVQNKAILEQIREADIDDLLGGEELELDIKDISAYIKDQVVMVTDVGGSIGLELCKHIARFHPKKLVVLELNENNYGVIEAKLNKIFRNKMNFDVVEASITDKAMLRGEFCKYKPAVIFHAYLHKHTSLLEPNWAEDIKDNIYGTLNMVQLAEEFYIKRFVLISTDKAVKPTNIVRASERIAEMVVQSFGKESKSKFSAVRFGNVLNCEGSVDRLFKKQIAQGGPVTVTHPLITRCFMTASEAAQLVLQAGAITEDGELFILDTGRCIKIDELARVLIRLSGNEPDSDIKIQYIGLRPGEKLYEELLLAEEGIRTTAHNYIFKSRSPDLSYNDIMFYLDVIESCAHDEESLKSYIWTMIGEDNYLHKEVAAAT